ncbi:MAG: tetratricopeptide repeat protein [Rhodospirillaceae bacterium]|nr:tetratricopeptide repeat protein [Rhodospirillaceae bacterium]
MALHRISLLAASALTAIALSTSAFAAGSASTEPAPSDDFKKAEKAIQSKDFATAEKLLTEYVKKKEKDASGWNYLAYAQRNQGKTDEAMKNYNTALGIDPNHKGALEYQGELFLKLGNVDAAKANLAKLEKICAAACEERDMLQAAIERAKDGKAAWVAPEPQKKGR